MTEPQPQPAPASPPDAIERGRYAIYAAPDGGWVIARSTTCDQCRDHGCGDQGDPITIPGMVVALAKRAANGDGVNPLKMLKAAVRNG